MKRFQHVWRSGMVLPALLIASIVAASTPKPPLLLGGTPGSEPGNPPVWTSAPVAGQFHELDTSTPVNINLASLMTVPGDSYALIRTSATLDSSELPAGLNFDSQTGRITGTPTETGSWVIWVRANKGVHDADASWAARSQAPGVYTRQRFEDPAAVAGGLRGPGGTANGIGGVREWSVWDDSQSLSGGGSLRQFYPDGASHPVSSFTTNWIHQTRNDNWDVADNGFAPGEEFYYSWAGRFDRATMQYIDRANDGSLTPDAKITILDKRVGFPGGGTNNAWEQVHHLQSGSPAGYYNRSPATSWEEGSVPTAARSLDIQRQPLIDRGSNQLQGVSPGLSDSSVGAFWSAYEQDRFRYGNLWSYESESGGQADGTPDPLSGGFEFANDEWFFQKVRVKVGNPGQNNTELQVWYAHHGQDWVPIVNKKYDIAFGQVSDFGGEPTTYEALWFLNLAYASRSDASRPYRQRNIDEIIVSSNDIPAPGIGDGTGTYRTADAMITLRVTGSTSSSPPSPDPDPDPVPAPNPDPDPAPNPDPDPAPNPDPDPQPAGIPAYIDGLQLFEARTLNGSSGAVSNNTASSVTTGSFSNPSGVFIAWSGGAEDQKNKRLFIAGGGHNTSNNNGVYVYDFRDDGTGRPEGMTLLDASASGPGPDGGSHSYYPDGRPGARQTYQYPYYEEFSNSFVHTGGSLWHSGNGLNNPHIDKFDLDTGNWSTRIGSMDIGGQAQNFIFDQEKRKGILFGQSVPGAWFFNAQTNTWSSAKNYSGHLLYSTFHYDPVRKVAFTTGTTNRIISINWDAETISTSDYSAAGSTGIASSNFNGAVYDPDNDRHWLIRGTPGTGWSAIYEVVASDVTDGGSITFNARSISGDSIPYTQLSGLFQGVWGRVIYLRGWNAIATLNSYSDGPTVIRVK